MPAMKFRPTVEELDGRVVPSAVLATPQDLGAPALAAPPAHPLHGTGQGTYTEPAISPLDAGIQRTLRGTVTLQGLGTFDVAGTVQGTGMIQDGRATGHLVLTNAHGTLTVELHGPTQAGFSPIPSQLVYSISGGTGAYAGAKGYGMTHLSSAPNPTPMPPVTPEGPMPPPSHGGRFQISFR